MERKNTMHIVVGSTNPVKVAAVTEAVAAKLPNARVVGMEVESGVPSQPMSDEETRAGAEARARAALAGGAEIGVGIEGGVFVEGEKVWNTVWCVVVEMGGKISAVNGARFILPKKLADELLKGAEMGPAMDGLTGIDDVRKKMGMIGVVTEGWIDRKETYVSLVKLAMGRLWSEWE